MSFRTSLVNADARMIPKARAAASSSVYTALLSRCKRVYLTKVDAAAESPDTFFPNLDKLPGWEVEHIGETVEENGVTYRFVEYINTKL